MAICKIKLSKHLRLFVTDINYSPYSDGYSRVVGHKIILAKMKSKNYFNLYELNCSRYRRHSNYNLLPR